MDFLKKNLGLIIYTIVCLVLCILITIGISRAGKTATESEEKVQRQIAFFESIKNNEVAITRRNQEMATQNLKLVDDKFYELRSWLAKQYALPKDPPPSSVECVQILQESIRKMRGDLESKGIVLASSCANLSFDALATTRVLPAATSVPNILRQLKIVQELVRVTGVALQVPIEEIPAAEEQASRNPKVEVTQLKELNRPIGLQVLEADLYTITPIDMIVVAPIDRIEKLTNLLQKESVYLFFLRKVSMRCTDQAPGGVIQNFDSLLMPKGQAGGRGRASAPAPGMMGEMMGEGFFPEEMMGAAPPRGYRSTPSARRRPAAAKRPDVIATELYKEDLVVFGERLFEAQLRLDLVEFLEPPKRETEEEE